MAKTKILTKEGLEIYDVKIKDYIQSQVTETPEGVTYVDPDETTEIEEIDNVTSAKLVSYSNADSNIEATNVQDAIDVIDDTKVNVSDIVDDLNTTVADKPLSANMGNYLKENLSRLSHGIAINDNDFNDLGDWGLVGIGTNMTNAPMNNPEVIYLVQHIPVNNSSAIVQYAKPLNMNDGKLLYFRQKRPNGTWDNWCLVGLTEDIITLSTELTKKVNTTDIVNNLESTDDKVPLSANMGNYLRKAISPIVNGVSLTNHDFNDLGEWALNGIGNNMLNAPYDDPEVVYLVQHIPAYNDFAVLQYAKALNMHSGEALFFRQRRHNGTWDSWHQVSITTNIVDNLLSDRVDLPLSANQGRILNESIVKCITRSYQIDNYTANSSDNIPLQTLVDNFSSDDIVIIAIIPMGGRISGSSQHASVINDGTYIRYVCGQSGTLNLYFTVIYR